jgi:hypothetical protein
MAEEHNSVQLQVADRHHVPLRFAHMKVAGHSDFTSPAAVVVCLRLNPEIMTSDRHRIFQIVDSSGKVVWDDCKIQDEVSKR